MSWSDYDENQPPPKPVFWDPPAEGVHAQARFVLRVDLGHGWVGPWWGRSDPYGGGDVIPEDPRWNFSSTWIDGPYYASQRIAVEALGHLKRSVYGRGLTRAEIVQLDRTVRINARVVS